MLHVSCNDFPWLVSWTKMYLQDESSAASAMETDVKSVSKSDDAVIKLESASEKESDDTVKKADAGQEDKKDASSTEPPKATMNGVKDEPRDDVKPVRCSCI